MTQEDIIAMARESGLETQDGFSESVFYFAKLVAEREREACASMLEDWDKHAWNPFDCAQAIRARGQA